MYAHIYTGMILNTGKYILENSTEIGRRIKEIRKTMQLTQQDFAEGIKISKAHVSAMERNSRTIQDRIIRMICFTYGVNEKWIITGKGKMFEEGRDFRLEELVSSFKKLDELLQDYVLKQIRLALDFQKVDLNIPKPSRKA